MWSKPDAVQLCASLFNNISDVFVFVKQSQHVISLSNQTEVVIEPYFYRSNQLQLTNVSFPTPMVYHL